MSVSVYVVDVSESCGLWAASRDLRGGRRAAGQRTGQRTAPAASAARSLQLA